MVAWPIKRLDQLCEITSSKRIFAADYVSEGVPFYRGREVTEKYKGNLDVSTELFITEEKFTEIERKFGAPILGDLLLTSVGTLGSVYVVKPGDRFYFKDGNLTWFRNFKGLDSQFLFYWIGSPQGKAELQKCTIGSSQSAFTIVLLKGMEVELPSLLVQQRIAGILSVYDELIENSQRRIKILEAMSRGLYREWFVHFRFPGHEYHPRVASALGEIPQGWAVKKVGDLVEIKKGKKPTVVFESAESGLKRHLLIDALRGGSSLEFVMPDKLISTTVDDTIMVMDGSGSGDVFIGYEGVIGSTLGRYRVVDVSDGGPFWLFLFLDTHLEEIKSKNIGSAIPHANKDFINGMSVAVAPKSVLLNFEKAVTPMFGLIRSLRSKTGALRRTRDLLLPRLLSGQIDIGEI